MAATSNRDRVGQGFELLAAGLEPFVEAHMGRHAGEGWAERFAQNGPNARPGQEVAYSTSDPSFLLLVLVARWDEVFRPQLGNSLRPLVFELRETRNRWAHNAAFSPAEAYRALDSTRILLEAVDAHEADDVRRAQDEVGRIMYERERTKEEAASSNVVDAPAKWLKPWRQVILPHDDVAAGRFNVAAFAADLELVRTRDPQTAPEYRDPVPLFVRTMPSGTGAITARRRRCTRPSRFATVPSRSSADVAGSTTSAQPTARSSAPRNAWPESRYVQESFAS